MNVEKTTAFLIYIQNLLLLAVFFIFSPAGSEMAWAAPAISVDCGKCADSLQSDIRVRAEMLLKDVSEKIGVDMKNPLRVEIAMQGDDFIKRAGGAPEWAVAIYENNRIIIRQEGMVTGSDGRFFNILEHELVHAVLDDMFDGKRERLPRWLNEGIAVAMSGDWESPAQWDRRKVILRSAIKKGCGFSFDELSSGFPRSSWLAEVAYAQSADLTLFMLKKGGWKKMSAFLERLAAGDSIEVASKNIYGEDFTGLSEEWYAYAGRPGGSEILMHVLVNIDFYLWIGMIILVMAGAAMVFRRRRKSAEPSDEYDPEDDWDELDEKWDRDMYGDRPWRPGRKN